jgi:hypothetical protein
LREVAQKLPAGYSYEFSGMSSEEIKAGDSTTLIFSISIVFVFLFLAALYESWSIPFSVLFAVPIGAFGSILTLTFLPNLSNNIYAQIGLITLIGLAAKNAILIVEFAKERVDSGMELVAATLEAVQLRLTAHHHDLAGLYFRACCRWLLQVGLPPNHVKQLAGRYLEVCLPRHRWLSLWCLFFLLPLKKWLWAKNPSTARHLTRIRAPER